MRTISSLAFLMLLMPAALADPAGTERVVETIRAERVAPDGRFSAYPRWIAPDRPTVSLALSGGFGRAVAHLGVLQALEEDGIEVDAIAGTSMGSVLGALACAGYSAAEIEAILRDRDWETAITGLDVPRRVLSESEEIRRVSPLVRVAFRRHRKLQVGALLESGLLRQELYRHLLRAQLESDGDFDRMACRFRAVATDALTGRRVAPASGDLVQIVSGSSAIPGVFRPVPVGDALLIDGGVVENIPVETARSFGTDLVVAVDATEGVRPKESLAGALDNLNRAIGLLVDAQGQLSLDRADLVIRPDVQDASLVDFASQFDVVTAAGRDAYTGVREALWTLLDSLAANPRALSYDAIEVEGTDEIGPDDLASRLSGPGGRTTAFRVGSELARALNRLPLADGRVDVVLGPSGSRLRFVFVEQAALKRIVRVDEAGETIAPPEDVAPGVGMSYRRAREIVRHVREEHVPEGHLFVHVSALELDPATGTATARVEDPPVRRIETEVQGEIRLHRARRFFDDFAGARFAFDDLVERLDELAARGAILDWSLGVSRNPDRTVDLAVRVRGDDYFEFAGGVAWRDALGVAGHARVSKVNLTGRGDFVDLGVVGSREIRGASLRYRTEYGVGFQNLGGEIEASYYDNFFPFVDSSQRIVDDLEEGYRRTSLHGSLIRRLRWGIVTQGGILYDRDRLDATGTDPYEERSRTSLTLFLELDRQDRFLFPTRGGALRARYELALAGHDLRKLEIDGDFAVALGRASRQTLTFRAGLGLSDRADRRPYYFDPGGHRRLYGFVPYGGAAPQFARAGMTWRLQWFDFAAARVYLEAGVDGLRTGVLRDDLRRGGGDLGVGVSVTAYTRVLGPISTGIARNDEGADVWFLTAGYRFLPD